MASSLNNSQKNIPVGEMMGNSISSPPTQQYVRPSIPTANNGVGTTLIAPPPSPQPTGPIPGSVGSGQIAVPPAPSEGPRGLGSNNIAPTPSQQQNGDKK